jgi:folate-binding protein YgfZ
VSAAEAAAAVRRGAGLFRLSGAGAGENERGLLRVSGADRVRWLNGMLSNDVAALAPGRERSGCYATLLTPKGRIVADLHVLLRPDAFWLDVRAREAAAARVRLERTIVADDVAVADAGAEVERLGLEGPAAGAILAAAGAHALPARDACLDAELGGTPVVVAGYGWTGEPAYQVFAPAGRGESVARALSGAGARFGLVEAGPEALEILRVEAGIPRLGAELGEEILPDEARLERAISASKGCYVGQEIVARLRSRGQVNHLLVGLRCEGAELPAPRSPVFAGDRRSGEITSACRSPSAGAIALAFVRREHAAPGTELAVEGRPVRVVELPFVRPGAAAA